MPLAFRNANVLEVAAGSGQNSFYVASLKPRSLTLLEPNPRGIADIRALYAAQEVSHTAPTLVEKKLEDFQPDRRWDVVLCENWLGSSAHERALLRKLGSFVLRHGVLVVTAVSPIGIAPNMIRRALAAKISPPGMSFDNRTDLLIEAFAPHLATIDSMTRSAADWVHDNLMNPAYFDLCLTVPMIFEEIGADFQIIGSNPVFSQDWRWFKSLYGEGRRFNAHFLSQYWSACHGFIDYKSVLPSRLGAANQVIENAALNLIGLVQDYENSLTAATSVDATSMEVPLLEGVSDLMTAAVGVFPDSVTESLREAAALLAKPSVTVQEVACMKTFYTLFGRETIYVSLLQEPEAGVN